MLCFPQKFLGIVFGLVDSVFASIIENVYGASSGEEPKEDQAEPDNQMVVSPASPLSNRPQYSNTGLFYHEHCLKHEALQEAGYGKHEERPARCSSSLQMLERFGFMKKINKLTPIKATKAQVLRVHSSDHFALMSLLSYFKCGFFKDKQDAYFNEHSTRAALLAAGAAIELMNGILTDQYANGFALVRPPGHHCERNKARGFCLFNSAAIAVKCALDKNLCQRVLIVDWDAHHGNGTENAFYNNPTVRYFSVHRYGPDPYKLDNKGKMVNFFPTTGAKEDRGNGSGAGYNVNVPLIITEVKRHGNKEYLLIWEKILIPICRQFKPEIILISAGFDACVGDPIGKLKVTPPCYGVLTRLLMRECSKVAVLLEGGYNLTHMPRAICCVNYALLNAPDPLDVPSYDVQEFFDEFKKSMRATAGRKDPKWFTDYGDEVETDHTRELYAECQSMVDEVIEIHQEKWTVLCKCTKKDVEDADGEENNKDADEDDDEDDDEWDDYVPNEG